MKYLIHVLNQLFFIFFIVGSIPVKAQEYPTDRLFMKHFIKAKCLRDVQEKVKKIKNKREMTLEHEVLLNKNLWLKIRANLPLSSSEKKRLTDIRKNGVNLKKLSAKKNWSKKSNEFKALRSVCK